MAESSVYGQVVEVFVPGIQGPKGAKGATGSVTAALQTLHDEAQTAATQARTAASTATAALTTMRATAEEAVEDALNASADASGYASTATTKALAAANSATRAETSASNAARSAATALEAHEGAALAANNAGISETNARNSATAASTSATRAASSARTAQTSEAGANAAVSAAAGSATTASTAAQQAADSANTASTAASNAGQYADSAQAQASLAGQYAEMAMQAAERMKAEDALKQSDWQQWDETAPDYIKNRTHYDTYTVTEGREEIYELDTFTSDAATGYGPLVEYFTLDPDAEYIVTYDGTEYRDEGKAFLFKGDNWCGKPVSGDPDYETYPFNIFPRPCEDYTVVFTDEPGEHTIKVEKVTRTAEPSGVKTIDPKYLPVDALQTDWRETSTTSLKYLQNKPVISYDANTMTLSLTGWASW